ncbi:hypothetical protein CH35J_008928 [Colletotrichum higginsianum]|uniref:Uncharacterized protein n=1 Tax=Colletotrichum higginsianum TaxID=80884 RepID=A0A4T0VTG0_9PEZI|nr:hypothetical protein CH35J_008928 [Colletotrichum higginsianum]
MLVNQPIRPRPIKTRSRAGCKYWTIEIQDAAASDDSDSQTGNTDLQTSPDTAILTPPDGLRADAENSLSPSTSVDNCLSASIDSVFPLCDDVDDSYAFELGYGSSDMYENEYTTVTDMGSRQKQAEVHLPLSLTTTNDGLQAPDDSYFSASLEMSWNEPAWSTVSPPLNSLLPPAYHGVSECPEDTGLLDHYSKVMLPTMGFKEDVSNPYEQHILPLSHRSSAVRSAIYALASAHREYLGLENTEGSACFHERAVAGLSAIIEDGDGFEEALATIVLLLQYDLVFRYFDVLNALTNGSSPVFTAPSSNRAYSPGSSPPPIVFSGIDPVFGMADDLWPTLHRLGELITMKCELQAAMATGQASKFAVLRTEYQTTFKAIERALESWGPILPPGFSLVNRIVDGPEDASEAELANIRWITSTALAYRQSALVYLYSTISEYPSSHSLVQKHAQAALWHCAAAVSHGGTGQSMLWPLFFSACHAICSRDRGLVRQAFTSLGGKKGAVDTEKPWAVVMDVWRRMDMRAYGKEQVGAEACPDLWKQVAASMKFGLVFG